MYSKFNEALLAQCSKCKQIDFLDEFHYLLKCDHFDIERNECTLDFSTVDVNAFKNILNVKSYPKILSLAIFCHKIIFKLNNQ